MTRKHDYIYTSPEDYLADFFVQTLLLILKAPDSVLEELEKAIKLSSEQRREAQERLQRILQKKGKEKEDVDRV